ncbi:hypothetical protein V5O48_000799 [Marasmius crinis-equi]|uniref:Uncharacterized protein n=1 Tax=Marasmius crinis-equi TaxID=585013 RepID=A0ABR3G0M0_9AGAR
MFGLRSLITLSAVAVVFAAPQPRATEFVACTYTFTPLPRDVPGQPPLKNASQVTSAIAGAIEEASGILGVGGLSDLELHDNNDGTLTFGSATQANGFTTEELRDFLENDLPGMALDGTPRDFLINAVTCE